MNRDAGAPERIRLVHCIGTMRVGGAEKQLAELIARLPRDRFDQALVLLQKGGPLVRRVEQAGCPVLELGYDRKLGRGDPLAVWAMGRTMARMIRFLRLHRPHILHAQLFWANLFGAVAGRVAGVPSLIVSHRQLNDHKAGRPLMDRLENYANGRARVVLVNSEAVRRDVLAHDRVDPAKLRRIYNGVVLEDFQPADPAPLRAEFGLAPGDLVVVAVANLHPYKGHAELIEAAVRLLPEHPRLRLILPGRDQGAGAVLRRLIAERKLDGVVHLPGERRDIPALLQLADVVVHPSHQEGFSNSILEAMAAARPLVVTNVGGNPEQVRDGENGRVVPPRDAAALAAALGELLADTDLRRSMGDASRRRIESEFSIDRTVRDYLDLYESLAESSSKP